MKLRLPLMLAACLLSCFSPIAQAADYYWVGTGSINDLSGMWEDASGNAVTIGNLNEWQGEKSNKIIIDKNHVKDNTNKNLGWTFNPLSIGGLEVNVAGFSLTPFSGSATFREIRLNEASANAGCTFVIDEDFALNPAGAGHYLDVLMYADWNISLAAGKSLTVNGGIVSSVNGKTINVVGKSADQSAKMAVTKSTGGSLDSTRKFSSNWNIKNAELSLENINILGAGSLTGDNALISFKSSAAESFTNDIIIKSGGMTLDLGIQDKSFSGAVSGDVSSTLTKKGSGTLVFAGDVTYAGAVNVTAGNLQIGTGSGTSIVTGNISLAEESSTLIFNRGGEATYSSVISGKGSLEKKGSGVLTLTQNNTYTGHTTISSGVLRLDFSAGAQDNILSSSGTLNLAGGGLELVGSGKSQSFAGIFLSADTASTLTLADTTLNMGVLSGTGSLLINYTGELLLNTTSSSDAFENVLLLNTGTNTAGYASVENGKVVFTSLGSLAPEGNLPNKVYELRGGMTMTSAETIGGLYIFSAASDANANTWTLDSGGMTVNGRLVVQGDDAYTITGGTLFGKGLLLSKDGTGDLTIVSDTDFSGGLALNKGVLNLTGKTAIEGNITLATGTTLNMSEGMLTGTLLGSGAINIVGQNQTAGFSGDLTGYTGTINMGADSIFELNNVGTPASLTITGSGTLALSGNTTWNQTIGAADLTKKFIVKDAAILNLQTGGARYTGKWGGDGTVTVSNPSANFYFDSVENEFNGTIVLKSNSRLLFDKANVVNYFADGFLPNFVGESGSQLFLGVAFNSEANAFKMGNLSGDGQIHGQTSNATAQQGPRYLSVTQTRDDVYNGTMPTDGFNRAIILIKKGEAKLTLTGNSASQGQLIIREGSVQLGNGGTSGDWAGGSILLEKAAGVVKSPQLIFNRSETYTFNNSITGAGDVIVGGNIVSMKKANTYVGNTTIKMGSKLILDFAANVTTSNILGSTSSLILSGGTLEMNGTATNSQSFAGMTLTEGTNSTITSTGTILNAGTLSGKGLLEVSGISSFGVTGGVAPEIVGNIIFSEAGIYYNATASGGTISKGNAFEELKATGNSDINYVLTKALTMTNTAKESIASLAISGTGYALNLGTGGLLVRNKITYDAAADQTVTIGGTGTLETAVLDKKGVGTLVINSALTVTGETTTAGVLTLGGGAVLGGDLKGAGTINIKGTDKQVLMNGKVAGYTGAYVLDAGTTLKLTQSETLNTLNITGSGTLSLADKSTATVNVQGGSAMSFDVNGSSVLTLSIGGITTTTGMSGTGTIVRTAAGNWILNSFNNKFTGTFRLASDAHVFVSNTTGATLFAEGYRPNLELLLPSASANGLVLGAPYTSEATAFKVQNLSGTGGAIRGDTDSNSNQLRYFSVAQTRDDVFGGRFLNSNDNRKVTLIKEGVATLTLSGDNESLADLTIKEGAIQLGAGGTTGMWAGNIVFAPAEGNTVQLIINREDGFGFSKNLTGAGELVINGVGTTFVNGTNTHTGGTTIMAGKTLMVESSTALGVAQGNLNLNAGSVFVSKGDAALTLTQKINALNGESSIGSNQTNIGKITMTGGASISNGATLKLVSAEIASDITGTGTLFIADGSSVVISAGGLKGSPNLRLGNGSQLILNAGLGTQSAGMLSFGNASVIEYGAFSGAMSFSDYNKNNGSLDIIGYTPSGSSSIIVGNVQAWEKVVGITLNGKEAMFDNRGRLMEYNESKMVGDLVSTGTNPQAGSDGHYTYQTNQSFFGAIAGETVDFTESFLFANGAGTYGFTTRDAAIGTQAGGFTVSSVLDGDRSLHLIGQGGADRVVVLTNVNNSYTGGSLIDNGTLRVEAAAGSVFDTSDVRILGVSPSTFVAVRLTNGGVLELATGADAYTYKNNFQLNDGGGKIVQTAGTHTLSGTITLNGNDGAVGREILNDTANEMILSGKLVSNGENTLTLTSKKEEGSLIRLNLKDATSSLYRLAVNGVVEMNSPMLTITKGITFGSDSSFSVNAGTLAVSGEISSMTQGANLNFNSGTLLQTAGSDLLIASSVIVNFKGNQENFIMDSGNNNITLNGALKMDGNNTLVKRGAGALRMGQSVTTNSSISVSQGTFGLNEGVSYSINSMLVAQGTTLDLSKGSSLTIGAGGLNMRGTLSGNGGTINGVNTLSFVDGSRYTASMSRQTWDARFGAGSAMSGSLTEHDGNIVFEEGSSLVFNTSLPISAHKAQITTSSKSTVTFKGASVNGTTTTPEIDWDSTQIYEFKLVSSGVALLGKDGQALTADNLANSVALGPDGWGAFLQAELALDNNGKDLIAKVNRNGVNLSSYAQSSNQREVAAALDYAMENYSSLDIRGTELGNIIQDFNKMGASIAEKAPEAIGMVGGLSNYQALAGQRTDMMRHLEAVRQRANAGKGLVGVSVIPDNAFWAEGTQGYSRVDGVDSSTPGFTAQSWGGAIGMDFLSAPTYSLGLAFAYSSQKVDSNQYAGQVTADNYYVDLYGRWESGNWNGVAVLSGGTGSVDTKRSLTIGDTLYQGKGSADSSQIVGMFEVAYNIHVDEEDGPIWQPYVGMAIGNVSLDGYTESGLGNASLVIDKQEQMIAQASLGIRLFKQNIDKEMQYETSRWELRAGLIEEFGDTDFTTRSSFLGMPSYAMSTVSEDIGKTALQIGGGFSAAIDESWSVFGDVNGEFRSGQTSMNSTIGLRCTF